MSPTGNVIAGRLFVVWFATDSVHDSGNVENDLNRRMKCEDDAGNTYATLVASVDGGTNGTHGMGAIFVSRLRFGLTTSNTVTVTTHTPGGTTAMAMSTAEFSMTIDPQKTWAVTSRSPRALNTRLADPGSITFGGSMASGFEYLLLHCLTAEGPNTDTYTWDSDYTQIAGDGTTGGADDSNMHVRGGWRIATLTNDTVDVTALSTFRDYTQLLTAVCEVSLDGSFPNWPVLDDFNRADENPLDNGTWNTSDSATDGNRGYLTSNQAAANVGGSFWSSTFTGGDGEVYMTIATIGTSPTATAVHFHTSGQANTTNMDGWAIEYAEGATNAVGHHITVGSSANGAAAAQVDNQRMRIWTTLTNGSKIGFQRRDPVTHVWVDYAAGNGWEWVGAVHEVNVINSGRAAFGLRATTTRIDDFGAGVEPGFIPQFYRRV